MHARHRWGSDATGDTSRPLHRNERQKCTRVAQPPVAEWEAGLGLEVQRRDGLHLEGQRNAVGRHVHLCHHDVRVDGQRGGGGIKLRHQLDAVRTLGIVEHHERVLAALDDDVPQRAAREDVHIPGAGLRRWGWL